MTAPSNAIDEAHARLSEALRTRTPTPPVRDLIGRTDLAAAYAVQQRINADHAAGGARVVGRKIGLTSEAVQQQLGVDQPDLGVLFDDMDVSGRSSVSMTELLQPKIEAEIAFELADDLADGDFSPQRVARAVRHAAPALEIVDSRITDWDISFGDTVADNASSALFVLGENRRTFADFTPKDAEMEMETEGAIVSRGNGAACLGDPLNALAWLARASYDLGDPLRAGEIILSGALGPMVVVHPGATYTAHITGLGEVSASFERKDA